MVWAAGCHITAGSHRHPVISTVGCFLYGVGSLSRTQLHSEQLGRESGPQQEGTSPSTQATGVSPGANSRVLPQRTCVHLESTLPTHTVWTICGSFILMEWTQLFKHGNRREPKSLTSFFLLIHWKPIRKISKKREKKNPFPWLFFGSKRNRRNKEKHLPCTIILSCPCLSQVSSSMLLVTSVNCVPKIINDNSKLFIGLDNLY